MNITEFPPEILITIFNYLNYRDLLSVSISCYEWFNIIEQQRYYYDYYNEKWGYPSYLMLNKYHKLDNCLDFNHHSIYSKCWKQLIIKKHRLNQFKFNLMTCKIHDDSLRTLVYCNESNMLITGSYDKSINIYNLRTLKYVTTFYHQNMVLCLQLQNNHLFSGSLDYNIKWWDIDSKKNIHTFNQHTNAVQSIAVNEEILYSVSYDGKIITWDLNTVECLKNFKGHNTHIRDLALTPNNILTCSEDQSVKIWDYSFNYVNQLIGHKDRIHCVKSDDNLIVSGDGLGIIKFWDLRTYKCIEDIKIHNGCIRHLQLDKSTIISGSWDNTIKIWSLSDKKIIKTFNHQKSVLCFQMDDEKMFSGDLHGTLYHWYWGFSK